MGRKLIDMTGVQVGQLTVLRRSGVGIDAHRQVRWVVLCHACSKEHEYTGSALRSGVVTTCGCERSRLIAARRTIHGCAAGVRPTLEYIAWAGMHSRCSNAALRDYPMYGGRGIAVCDRWSGEGGFKNFLSDMGLKPSKDHSIDRFPDQNGNYEPGNCRWATDREQARNRRTNRLVEWQGKRQTIQEWSEAVGIGRSTIELRLKLGWTIEKALTYPVDTRRAGRRKHIANQGERS